MALASISYAEFQPVPSVGSLIECFWSLTLTKGAEAILHRAFPDGRVDIVITQSGSIQVSGVATGSTSWRIGSDRAVLGARLRAGSVPAVLGISATEIRERIVPLDLIWGSSVRELSDRLETEANDGGRLQVLRWFLADASPAREKSLPQPVADCVSLLSSPPAHSHEIAQS